MAIKPMGKAIIILVVVASIGAGVVYSGALNKLPTPAVEETKMIEPVSSAPVVTPQPKIEAVAAPVQTPTTPTAEAGTDGGGNDAAFEAVMKAAAAKKGSK